MHRKTVWTIAAIIVMLLAAAVPAVMNRDTAAQAEAEKDGVQLLALNVGKADSLILWVEGKVYLIDTGTIQSWGAVRTALNALNITALDGVFLTHTDKDHAGGMDLLAKSGIQVKAWYGSAMYTGVKQEKHPLLLAAAQSGMRPIWLKAGDAVAVTQDCTFRVLGPVTQDDENENNNSLVMALTTPDGNVMLAGDMEFEEERQLITAGSILPCQVLKVAHHGDNDSTSAAFVGLVSPQVAVISTSTAEENDTPAPKVLSILKQAGAQTAVTELSKGGILVTLKEKTASASPVEWKSVPDLLKTVKLTGMDAGDDVLTLQNTGTEAVSLAGWYVFSTKGEEIFFFPEGASIAPGATARLGSQSTSGNCDWRFDEKNVWHQKRKDEAVLYDAWGREVARLSNGMTEE